jgi:hypothetical protein
MSRNGCSRGLEAPAAVPRFSQPSPGVHSTPSQVFAIKRAIDPNREHVKRVGVEQCVQRNLPNLSVLTVEQLSQKCETEQRSSQLDGPLTKHLRFSLLRAGTEQVEYRWRPLCKLREKIRRDDRKVRYLPTWHALKRHAEIL